MQPEFRDFYKLELLCFQNQVKFPQIQYNTDFSFFFFTFKVKLKHELINNVSVSVTELKVQFEMLRNKSKNVSLPNMATDRK